MDPEDWEASLGRATAGSNTASSTKNLQFLQRVLIQVNEGTVAPSYREFSDAAAVVDNWANEELFRRVQIHLCFPCTLTKGD
jgi:hypothetical protein